MVSEDFKWRRIHPGIGKTQRKIMDILEERIEKKRQWIGIENLTSKVYYPDLRGATLWMGDEYPITKSQINTVRRAVRALEKRGLVKTEKPSIPSSRGWRPCKVVGLPKKQEARA